MEQTVNRRTRPRLWAVGRALVFLLVVAGLVLLARRAPVDELINWLKDRVGSLGVWGPVAFGALFVVLTIFLLPATPVVLASGAVFGPVPATLIISIASTVSAALSFLLSRYVAHDRVAARVGRHPKLRALYQALAGPDGWKIVAAVRLSQGMPFGLQNLLFGASPVRFLPFLAATVVGMLPGTALYAYFGHVGAAALPGGGGSEPPAGPVEWSLRAAALAVAVLAVLYAGHLGRRILREKAHVDLSEPE
jgi:uncharacterized membrane protein YdjX (TVP38/TMEM64 family)